MEEMTHSCDANRRTGGKTSRSVRNNLAAPILAVFMLLLGFAHAEEDTGTDPVKVSSRQIEEAVLLKEREAALQAGEKELEEKRRDLEMIRNEVDEKIARLSALQNELKEQLAQFENLKDKQFKNLVNVYSEMSATKLAPLLGQMDDETVARILRAMKTDNVAKVLPKLEKEKAVRVSVLLGML